MIGFRFEGFDFPLEPKTVFYDWLYCSFLSGYRDWAVKLYDYAGFTDTCLLCLVIGVNRCFLSQALEPCLADSRAPIHKAPPVSVKGGSPMATKNSFTAGQGMRVPRRNN